MPEKTTEQLPRFENAPNTPGWDWFVVPIGRRVSCLATMGREPCIPLVLTVEPDADGIIMVHLAYSDGPNQTDREYRAVAFDMDQKAYPLKKIKGGSCGGSGLNVTMHRFGGDDDTPHYDSISYVGIEAREK